MSYILDALKKLENEKTRKNRGAGMFSISGELFKEEKLPPPGGTIWKITAVVVVASLVTFGITWFFLKADKARDGVQAHFSTPVSAGRVANPKLIPVGPAPQLAATTIPQQPLAVPPVSVSKTVRPNKPVVKATAPSAVKYQRNLQNRSKKDLSLATQLVQPVVTTIPPPLDVRVSGIAWQEEHRARRAVVNGFLMQEGGSVSGAKITEIFQDRVRFSQAGKIFEVYLLASGVPGTAK